MGHLVDSHLICGCKSVKMNKVVDEEESILRTQDHSNYPCVLHLEQLAEDPSCNRVTCSSVSNPKRREGWWDEERRTRGRRVSRGEGRGERGEG